MAKLNGITIPTTIANTGAVYLFAPPMIIQRNGLGEAVTAGYSTIMWQWATLSQADYNWWYTTLLAGAASLTCTGTNQLYNNLNVLTTFPSVIVYRPQHSTVSIGIYHNVTVNIGRIIT